MKISRCLFLLIVVSLVHVRAGAQGMELLIPFMKDRLWGYADTTGALKITPIYDSAGLFNEGMAKVVKSKLSGYLDVSGKYVIEPLYESITPIQRNFYLVKKAGKYGVAGRGGVLAVKIKYEQMKDLGNGFYEIKLNKKVGILHFANDQFSTLLPVQFERIDYKTYPTQFIAHTASKGVQVYDANGKLTGSKPAEDDEMMAVEGIAEGFAGNSDEPARFTVYQKGNKYGLITGKRLLQNRRFVNVYDTLPGLYDEILPRDRTNFIVIRTGRKWGVMDEKGTILLEPNYDELNEGMSSTFSFAGMSQRFWVKNDGKWGLVGRLEKSTRTTNEVLIPLEFDSIVEHGRDYLIMKKGSLYGLYSIVTRKPVTPVKYAAVSHAWVYNSHLFDLFAVKNSMGVWVYVGENGVEFWQ